MSIITLQGDCRDKLREIADRSVQTVVTSPPYYGLRKYGNDPREIGQEAQPDCLAWAAKLPPCGACYVCAMRDVFAGLWRVLRDDGTVWLNLGDSYAGSWGNYGGQNRGNGTQRAITNGSQIDNPAYDDTSSWRPPTANKIAGLKEKDLLGIPWRVALALQSDGWYLRSDIVWSKPNCMPESVTDRPTRAHEYVFMLAKSARYFYDAAAIAEAIAQPAGIAKLTRQIKRRDLQDLSSSKLGTNQGDSTRNRRTVWTIATQPYSGAHYATMPEALIEPCILAGSAARACEHCGAAWGQESEPTGHANKREPAHVPGNTTTKVDSTGWAPTSRPTDRFAPRCACPDSIGSARSVVLDPFGGSGTVGKVALRYQRDAILIELNAAYIEEHIEKRTDGVQAEMFV